MTAHHALTTVSATAMTDEDEAVDIDLTSYVEDGLVLIATAHAVAGEDAVELEPHIAMTHVCAETFARGILARCAEARGAVRREAGDA